MSRMISYKEDAAAPTFTKWEKEFKTKDGIYSYLSSNGLIFTVGGSLGMSYSGFTKMENRFNKNSNDAHVVVFHAEKIRRKSMRVKPIKKQKVQITREGQPKNYVKKDLRDSHWKVTFFKIRKDRIISLKQHNRKFEAVLKQS